MGQQQLLLVILVTIIVGIATVVAINTFGSASANANQTAVRNDMASIAAGAQGYYMKPDQLGGGGQSFSGMTFKDIGFGKTGNLSNSDQTIYNQNGTYKLSGGTSSQITLTADPSSDDNYAQGTAGSSTNSLTATITRNDISYPSN